MIFGETQAFVEHLSQLDSPQAIIDTAARQALKLFSLDRVIIRYYLDDSMLHASSESNSKYSAYHSPLSRGAKGIVCGSRAIELPIFIADVERSNRYSELTQYLRRAGSHSVAIAPFFEGATIRGWMEFHQCSRFKRWDESDKYLYSHLAALTGFALKLAFGSNRSGSTSSAIRLEAGQKSTSPEQQQLADYARRIEALYQVSRALQLNLDPSIVCLKGLRAVVEATSSDCGIALLYDKKSGVLELVAAQGVSQDYVDDVERTVNGPSLVRVAVEQRQGLLIEDIQLDSRAVVKLAHQEGLHPTIVMPLLSEDNALGAIALFRKRKEAYTTDDFELVGAAANQIALAVHQANLFSSQRRQAKSVSALYRISHELTRHFTPKEIAERAFAILHEELACKRIWLGVINEQGTHLVGKGGFGPGMRKRVSELQIELQSRHDMLDQAIRTKEAVVIKPEDNPDCGVLHRVLRRLNPGPFVIVPMVSLGQVVGVLVIEPSVPSGFFSDGKLSILSNMAGEIGYAFIARRYEKRVAEADKMKMAGLFASGVAHNFNNLLQAVIGQCSLIDMQLNPDSPLKKSVNVIQEAAQRGGGLINQLLNFTQQSGNDRRRFALGSLLDECVDLYRSILGSRVKLSIEVDADTPEVFGDFGQLQQAIINLLVNAKEAIPENSDGGLVKIHACGVRLRTAEVDPELPPGRYVRISITDNGHGMDEEKLSRCFEPFFTTKNVDTLSGIGVGGSGLGLSTAYSILKAHEGVITVQSELSVGSTFVLYVPALYRAESSESAPLGREEATLAQPAQALLLRIEGKLALTLSSLLEKEGVKGSVFSSEQKFMSNVSQARKPVICFFDIETLGADISDLLSCIDSDSHVLKSVVFAFEPESVKRKLSGLRDVMFIKKPVNPVLLENELKGIFARLKRASVDGLKEINRRIEVEETSAEGKVTGVLDKGSLVEPVKRIDA